MDPQIKSHLAAGRELYLAGEYERARPHLEAVRDAEQGFADVHNMLGFIHFEQGRPEQAREELERALVINPHYTEAVLNLAVVCNELGLYDEGRRLYERAHHSRGSGGLDQLEPLARGKIANMHADLGDAYLSLGLGEHAIKEFQKALRVCPTFVDIRTKLANALRDAGRTEEALDEYQAIVDLSPEYLPGRTHYGITLWRAGRLAQAREQWSEVLARDPENRSCQVYLSMTADKGEAPADDGDGSASPAPVEQAASAEDDAPSEDPSEDP
ncbi:MAG: tetratricopeptide repeat protein [Myxococcales bacterium]|nr:tetratricopeptide repeat protein [Myxococcales bacterium]MCB9717151.1 tetratricopeptide repeat protein [Myxococcales bacterium]